MAGWKNWEIELGDNKMATFEKGDRVLVTGPKPMSNLTGYVGKITDRYGELYKVFGVWFSPENLEPPPIYYAEIPKGERTPDLLRLVELRGDTQYWRYWVLDPPSDWVDSQNTGPKLNRLAVTDFDFKVQNLPKHRLVKVTPEELIEIHKNGGNRPEMKLCQPVEADKRPDQPGAGFPPFYKTPDWKPLFFHTRSKGEPDMRNNEVTRSARVIDWIVRRAAKLGIRCTWDVTKFALKMGILYAAIFHINWNAFLVLGSSITEFVTTVIR